jgi:hypothetical protein
VVTYTNDLKAAAKANQLQASKTSSGKLIGKKSPPKLHTETLDAKSK